jgi:enoyl-CoA hydratase/carnithine racemase
MSGTVVTTWENGVRTLTLNRPHRLNAIDQQLITDLLSALSEAHADPKTRAIVLRGNGRAFCSGDDLIDYPNHSQNEKIARRFLEDLQDVTRQIVFGEKVVVGAVHGWAVGGGLEWSIDCDLLLMAEGTRCFFPETRYGMIVTGGVTALLPRIVGLQQARGLILLGDRFDAQQALAMGLCWRVLPEESLFAEAQKVAERIAELPERGVRDLKRIVNRADQAALEEALALELEAVVPAFLDPDSAARIAAFKD